ncbi:hypothetical protein E3G71_002078 [Mycobacteroides abscessus]|nr:hypothetical protein [Mycobacteroides abscessus]MBE5519155.1 hypothetical protein [Mycobacteroides abscessus]
MTVESAVERIVYDCAADIDLEEIEEMLAPVRSQLSNYFSDMRAGRS